MPRMNEGFGLGCKGSQSDEVFVSVYPSDVILSIQMSRINGLYNKPNLEKLSPN